MFVCRRSVFEELQQRDQSVFVIATSCVLWPGCTPRIQTRFHLQVRLVRFIRFRGTFFPFRTLRVTF